jgi:hypothetical protein
VAVVAGGLARCSWRVAFRTRASGSGAFGLHFSGRHGCIGSLMETMGRVISVECARGFDGVVGLFRALLSIIEDAGRSI